MPSSSSSSTLFLNYIRNYLLCCIFPDKTYDPVVFEENHIHYHVFFGVFHIKNVLPNLIILKTGLLFIVVIYVFITADDDLLRLFPGGVFIFSIAATANVILLVGIHYKSHILIIPYFLTYVLFVISLILLLFINFLDTANKKDTLTGKSLLHNFSLLTVLIFEVYTILLAWRMFVYICDYRMDMEVKEKERSRKVEEKLKHFDRRDCVPIVVHVWSDSDVDQRTKMLESEQKFEIVLP